VKTARHYTTPAPRLSIGNFNKNSPKSRTNLVQSAQTPRQQPSLGKPCRTFLHKKNTFPAPFIVQQSQNIHSNKLSAFVQ